MSSGWSRTALFLGAIAILALAMAIGDSLVPAIIAAVLLALAGIFITGRRPPAAHPSGMPAASSAGPAVPAAAAALLESLDDPVIVLDGAGRILLANQSSHALVGQDAGRKHISAVLRNPEMLEAVERVLAGGAPESITFSILVPLERHFRAHIARLGNGAEGAPVVVQLHDLTAMRRSEEMRADFVANASHELRTPLAAVSGFIDTLRGHAKNDAEARERFLEIMSVETRRMRRLIDDLLSLTRIELNEHNPPSGVADIVSVVRDAAAALAPLAEADGIKLEIARGEPMQAVGDRDELIQVFQNLIHNAIKYGRQNGTVRVRFGRAEGSGRGAPPQVFAAVEDEGEGIPREAIPRLTERFYRVDVKRSRERGGTGLGLAIVKHILNRHHGRLQIDSTPGKGSTFTVFLPAAGGSSEP